jgi:transcriptional regulator with XRE-family HTH domain
MGRPRKVLSKPNRDARAAIGANLIRIIEREFPGKTLNFAYQKIAQATGASASSIKRIVAGETSATTDTLSNIAYCLGYEHSDLTKTPDKPEAAEREFQPRPVSRES